MLSELQRSFSSTRFGRASPAEMGKIYASARIVFNSSIRNDVNMRYFEAMGAGAVLLTDRVVENGVEELFEEGVHFVEYHGSADLLRVARSLIADPARCASIGSAAQRLVLERHTYQHRADFMTTAIAAAERRPRPEPADVFAACLSLGLTVDATDSAADALASTGGGRFQRALGVGIASVLRLTSALARASDWVLKTLRSSRHA
jgi:Glycosyl transferases group 1